MKDWFGEQKTKNNSKSHTTGKGLNKINGDDKEIEKSGVLSLLVNGVSVQSLLNLLLSRCLVA